MNRYQTVLAIDAAWTTSQPSGVALVQYREIGWHCIALTPSYRSFTETATKIATEWSVSRFPGSEPDIPRLLAAAERLAGRFVELVTLDMPRLSADSVVQLLGTHAVQRGASNVRSGMVGMVLVDMLE